MTQELMSPLDWLQANAYGFGALTNEERDAVMHFSLLWALFEGSALKTRGSAQSILNAARCWERKGKLNAQAFEDHITYFRNRYFAKMSLTYHFEHLYLRKNDYPDLVVAFLKSETADTAEVVAALLIIVYRFRNNLFHGVKWAYGIRGQLENFRHANSLLMKVLELDDRP